MRLPPSLTKLSPVGETLDAVEQGGALLEEAAAERNRQLSVSTAEEGLSLWERDLSLPDGAGTDPALRRARILAALDGAETLSRERLERLAVSVGGADRGAVEEAFADFRVTLYALFQDREPRDLTALKEALQWQGPSHLTVEAVPAMSLRCALRGNYTLFGRAHLVLRGLTERE